MKRLWRRNRRTLSDSCGRRCLWPNLPADFPVHARHPAHDVPRPAVDDAAVRRVRHRRRVERALSLPARAGRQRPERRVRPAHADGLRLRPPAGRGRSRPRRRGDRLDRRHGRRSSTASRSTRLDVDDDQRDGDHPAGALRRRRAATGRAARAGCRARSRTTSSRNTSRAAPTSIRRAHSLRIVTDIFAWCERELPNWNTISISGYHIREAGSTAVQEVAFTLANAIAYVEAAVAAGLDVNRLRPAAVVLLRRAQRLPRGDRQVPRGAAAVGDDHARPVRRHEPARAAAALPHPDGRQHADRAAARQQHRPRRACRRWRRCSAARSRCTATAATKRWRCRPRRRRASRCGRSRSSRPRPASPNTVDPVGGSWAIEERTDAIEREARALIDRIDAAGGTLAAIEAG